MVDFRYHLVSLVAVLLALAAGVVLGAGPLRSSVGGALAGQAEQLRAERDALADRAQAQAAQVRERDAFLAAAAGPLEASALTGRRVALVVLPGAAAADADAVAGALGAAGAAVPARVGVRPAWVDPGRETFRRTLVAQAAPYLQPRPAADASAAEQLAAVLAQGVLAPGPGAPASTDPETDAAGAATGLQLLATGGLAAVDGDPSQRADAVVVVGPASGAGVEDGDGADAVRDAWLPLVAALSQRGATVVAAPVGAASPGGLLAGLRTAGLAGSSSVDSLGTPMGPVATALALAERLGGGSGQYGSGPGATAPLPTGAAGAAGPTAAAPLLTAAPPP